MNKALTQKQSDFAAEHHDLVFSFLNRFGYSENDYYDIVVFGYLQAVQVYFERQELRDKYAFSTIAFSRMRGAIGNYFKCESRRIRNTVSLDAIDYKIPANTGSIPELLVLEKECRQELVYLDEYREPVAA